MIAIVSCASRPAYAAAVRARAAGEDARLPVLGGGARVDALASFLGVGVEQAEPAEDDAPELLLDWARTREPASHDAVLSVSGDPYALAAAALALLSNRALHLSPSWAELPERARQLSGSVALVGAPSLWTTERISALIGTWTRRPLLHQPLGVVTAHTLEACTRLVAKIIAYRGRPPGRSFVLPARRLVSQPLSSIELVPTADFTPRHAERLTQDAFDLVSLSTHGDSVDADLRTAVLCGRLSGDQAAPTHSPAHFTQTCLEADRCPRNRGGELPRLYADQLRCRVVFAETCTGVGVFDAQMPAELSLALATVEGLPEAYLSSTKIIRTTSIAVLLMPAMLEAGVELGVASAVIDAVHRSLTEDAPSYLLIGDPTTQLRETSGWRVGLGDLRLGAPQRVGLGATPRSFLLLQWSGPLADAAAEYEDLALEVLPSGAQPGRVIAALLRRELGAPVTVVVFTPEPEPLGVLELRIVRGGVARVSLERRIATLERNLEQLRIIHVAAARQPARQKLARDLDAIVPEIDGLLGSMSRGMDLLRQPIVMIPSLTSEQLAGHLTAELARLDARMAELWPSWEMGSYQLPLYEQTLRARGPERTGGPCYVCGLPILDHQMVSRGSALSRTITHCVRCRLLHDRGSDDETARIEGPRELSRGARTTQWITLRNDEEQSRVYAAALNFSRALPWFRAELAPATQTFAVAAHTTCRVPFDIVVGEETVAGVYNLVLFVAHALSWNVSVKPIVIVR